MGFWRIMDGSLDRRPSFRDAAVPPATDLHRSPADAASARGGENFPVALRVLPREPRGHLVALYAYARWVDDLVVSQAFVGTTQRRSTASSAAAAGPHVVPG